MCCTKLFFERNHTFRCRCHCGGKVNNGKRCEKVDVQFVQMFLNAEIVNIVCIVDVTLVITVWDLCVRVVRPLPAIS